MKKSIKILLVAFGLCLATSIGVACGGGNSGGGNEGGNEGGGGQLQEITGVTFSDATYAYNGEERELLISGTLPEGVSAVYTNNKGTNANTYQASVTLSGEGYQTKTLTAMLKIEKINYDMSDAVWQGQDFTYDGNAKTVEIVGLPEGVTVKEYSNNTKIDAGEYTATVAFNYDTVNYNAPSVSAYEWEIEKASFVGLMFNGETFDYDGTEKTIEVVGVIPPNSSVVYTCEENADIQNSAVETGTYTITVLVTNKNYFDWQNEAVLKIQGEETERFIVSDGNGTIYFANALDNDYLYSYDGTEVAFVSYDIPYNFAVKGDGVYFRSKSLFGGAIKGITDTGVSVQASEKGEYLTTDGTYFYYAVNALTQANSGIYKLDISQSEPIVTQLSEGKAKYLQYNDGYLYYADGTNGYKLTKIAVDGSGKTLIRDEKISALTVSNNYLFYTVNNLLGDYIENYNLSDGTYKKITMDAGTNLTVIGNKIYYVNVDLFTSYVKGDGIYWANAYPLTNNSFSGTMFVGDDTYSSLTKLSENKIAYYRVSDQMLCVHNLSTGSVEEVLEGFVAPERTPLSMGSKTAAYNGQIYYLDLYKDKTLICYNPANGTFKKLTANKISDFSIIGDYLYYNSVSYLVNNDLYRVNLKTGGLPERISTNDCVDVVFADSKVFYVEQNAAGIRTAVHQIDASGIDTMMYSKGVNNLRYYDGYIYFIDGDELHRMSIADWTLDETQMVRNKDVDVFEISDGVIYFREVLILNKNLSKINVDGTGYSVIIEKTYDPVEIIVKGNVIYFYSSTVKTDTTGLYKVNTDGTGVEKLMNKTVDSVTYYLSSVTVAGNDVYFVNYAVGGVGGDSHLYKLSLTNNTITKIA